MRKNRILFVIPELAHYRIPVLEALADEMQACLTIICTNKRLAKGLELKHDHSSKSLDIHVARAFSLGSVLWIDVRQYKKEIERFDHIVLLGNVKHLSNWWLLLRARWTSSAPITLWTHGVLASEHGLKRVIRTFFYNLSSKLVVFSHRSMDLLKMQGVTRPIFVIRNSSFSESAIEPFIPELETKALSIRDDCVRVLFVGRVLPSRRLPLLVKACYELQRRTGLRAEIDIVGAGTETNSVETLAKSLAVSVTCHGPVYSPEDLFVYFSKAHVLVYPGPIGLAAVQSIFFFTPVVTNDNLNSQKPEHEAIVDGVNGSFFREDDASDLSRKIEHWYMWWQSSTPTYSSFSKKVREEYSAEAHAKFFAHALQAN